jgi:hypothetical protein
MATHTKAVIAVESEWLRNSGSSVSPEGSSQHRQSKCLHTLTTHSTSPELKMPSILDITPVREEGAFPILALTHT